MIKAMVRKPDYTLEKLADSADDGKRLVWSVGVAGKAAGSVRIELEDSAEAQAPGLILTLDDSYRGQDIESAVLKDTIRYAYCNLPYAAVYSRHQTADKPYATVLRKLGFEPFEKPYKDDHDDEWQDVKLVL